MAEKNEGGKLRSLTGFSDVLARTLMIMIPMAAIIYAVDIPTRIGVMIYKEQYLGLFLALFLSVIFLKMPALKSSSREYVAWYDWILVAASLVVYLNISLFYASLIDQIGFAEPKEVIMAAVAILILIEAARRIIGIPLVVVGLVMILYAHFSYLVPGLLNARGVSWPRLLVSLYLDPNSILGVPMGVAGTMVVGFLLFGSCMFIMGGDQFFSDVGMALMGGQRGGAAKMAVVASCLFGSLSGSAAANVAVTGAVTIPLMKKTGYSAPFAGAVEAVASTGGLIMPPVMGITAFMMAEFLSIPYYKVALAAAIPALLYYLALLMQVHWEAVAKGIEGLPREELPRIKDVLKKGWYFIFPAAALLYFLFVMLLEPGTAAIYASGIMLAVGLSRKENRVRFGYRLLGALQDTGSQVLIVGCACAMAGIVIGCVSLTNLGINLSNALIAASGNNSLLLLALAAVGSIILGMGMPIAATYVMLVILIAPAMIAAGIRPMAAHMFMNFFGAMSFVTPPVAIAAYVAAGIAKCDPIRVGFIAVRLGIAAYLVPFYFAYRPALLLIGSPLEIVHAAVIAILGILAAAMALAGFTFSKLNIVQRVIMGMGSLALLWPDPIMDVIGLVFFAMMVLWNWFQNRSEKKATVG
jgi:TRAP transporter 4TM/12TM fusion protein